MKRESVLEKLNAIKDGQDPAEVLDWLMNENGSDINTAKASMKSAKDELAEAKAEVERLQKEREAAEAATMTKEELLERQIQEYEAKKGELDVRTNRVAAEGRLIAAGLTTDDAAKILDRVVVADAEATDGTVSAILEVLESQRSAVEASTKQKLIGGTPSPAHGEGSAAALTKAQFDSMSYMERVRLHDEQPELYAQLNNEGE